MTAVVAVGPGARRGPPPMVARLRRAVGGVDGPRRAGPDAQEATMTAKRKLSDEERDERREQDRQRLKDAA